MWGGGGVLLGAFFLSTPQFMLGCFVPVDMLFCAA